MNAISPSHAPAATTRAMVHARTRELALAAGRPPPYVTQADYEEAKRQLTGEQDLERQIAILDTAPAVAGGERSGNGKNRGGGADIGPRSAAACFGTQVLPEPCRK